MPPFHHPKLRSKVLHIETKYFIKYNPSNTWPSSSNFYFYLKLSISFLVVSAQSVLSFPFITYLTFQHILEHGNQNFVSSYGYNYSLFILLLIFYPYCRQHNINKVAHNITLLSHHNLKTQQGWNTLYYQGF